LSLPAPLTAEERAALSGRVAVVTGASRGIGYATAALLGACGVQVIALARTVKGLEELDDQIRSAGGPAATLVPIDVTDGPGVDRLGASIHERWGKLDIFIGNAGLLGPVSPLAHLKAKAWSEVIDVNLSANWRLLRTLDPLLRAAGSAHVVFLTTELTQALRPFFGAYQVSKIALEGLAQTYALETEATGIKVEMVAPGPTRTALRSRMRPGEDQAQLPAPTDMAPGLVRLCV